MTKRKRSKNIYDKQTAIGSYGLAEKPWKK